MSSVHCPRASSPGLTDASWVRTNSLCPSSKQLWAHANLVSAFDDGRIMRYFPTLTICYLQKNWREIVRTCASHGRWLVPRRLWIWIDKQCESATTWPRRPQAWARGVGGDLSTGFRVRPPPPQPYTIHHSSSLRRYWRLCCSTVIDIWALQSQPNFQPRATLPSTDSPGSSRVPSNEIRTPVLDGGNDVANDNEEIRHESAAAAAGTRTTISSPRPSSSSNIVVGQKSLAPVPNNWGEVVISPRRKKGGNNNKGGVVNGADAGGGGDIFGVLRVN